MKKIDKSNRFFLHQQFMRLLKKGIKEGEYKPSELISSERNLVERYKISRSTVRRAIAQLIAEGWLYSVPGTGTFVSENLPQEKKGKKAKSKNIACVLKVAHSPFDSPYYSKIFKSMQSEVARTGYHLSFYSFVEESEASPINIIRERNLDGVIFIGAIEKNIILNVHRSKTPFVLIDNCFSKRDVTTIIPDNRSGAYEATKYLIKLGHKKIFFMGGSLKDFVVTERFNGYKEALAESNIPYKNKFFVKSHYRVSDGYSAMEKILKSGNLPSAVLAINDEGAIGAMKALQENSQLKIPKDMSIVGFDDIDWGAHTNPPLTTVRVQKEEIGRLAIEFLIKKIENEKFVGAKVIIPTELVIRSSCSKPPGA